jgi:hypothetical protein
LTRILHRKLTLLLFIHVYIILLSHVNHFFIQHKQGISHFRLQTGPPDREGYWKQTATCLKWTWTSSFHNWRKQALLSDCVRVCGLALAVLTTKSVEPKSKFIHALKYSITWIFGHNSEPPTNLNRFRVTWTLGARKKF